MEENPLHRAHALSAKASSLLKPTTTDRETLSQALLAYKEATELFEQAMEAIKGEDEMRTLQLLVNQHRKLAKDVERRIAAAERSSSANDTSSAIGAAHRSVSQQSVVGSNVPSPARPAIITTRRTTTEGVSPPRRESVGLATAASMNAWPAGISTRLGVPPFSLRPANWAQQVLPRPAIGRQNTSPPGSSPTNSNHQTPGEPFSLSPLYSSSSSDESYLNLGAVPDTLDPFSRFWGMLENMLDDISNPVAFASAPLGADATVPGPSVKPGKASQPAAAGKKNSSQGHEPLSSPTESFYVVPPSGNSAQGRLPSRPDKAPKADESTSLGGKTPEELALENYNLRQSLDAIASHAEKLEQANKALQKQHEERERTMRSIAVGMRREAQKVKQGQDLIRSQLMASMSQSQSPASGRIHRFSPEGGTPAVPPGEVENALRERVRELEDQVKKLQVENEKSKGQAEKYRDKLNQIKVNARAKRDAKLAGEGSAKSGGSSGKKDANDD